MKPPVRFGILKALLVAVGAGCAEAALRTELPAAVRAGCAILAAICSHTFAYLLNPPDSLTPKDPKEQS